MNGSKKLKPLMIGKSKNPRCFTVINSFPLDYEANRKAWMTLIFLKADIRIQIRKNENRTVENCAFHR